MRKYVVVFSVIIFCACNTVFASHTSGCHNCHGNHSHHHSGRCGHYSHSSSQPKILVNVDNYDEKTEFADCTNHSLITHTKTLYYSDGTRNVFRKYTILNKDGGIVLDNLNFVKHQITTAGKHYFIVKNPEFNSSRYMITDSFGNNKTSNLYNKIQSLGQDRLIVKKDKKYGIIDFDENVKADIKYNLLKPYNNLLISKYNGYYGLLDANGKIILRNEYDKITKVGNIFILKKMGKYGIANSDGNIILETRNDKIKKDGDYLKVKFGNKYGIYDTNGKIIAPINYKKVRIKRNNPEIYENKTWTQVGVI